jgi:3-polyprenyl-4-hydroxybenzoate decarboxylase
MLRASENGGIIFPLTPQFYAKSATIEEMVDWTAWWEGCCRE